MRTILIWAILSGGLFVPLDVVQIGAALILFTFFPGWVLVSLFDPGEENLTTYLVYGVAFVTILVYYCSWFLYWYIPAVISLCCALFLEKRRVPLPRVTRSTVLLWGCIIFMITYLYPWRQYIAFFPPGNEMKLHLLFTNSIMETHAFPASYAPLYPEISHIGHPLGFHGITAVLSDIAAASPIATSTILGLFIGSLGCVSVYLLGKTLFSEKIGCAAAFSFTFLSFLSHQLGASGTYIVLAGITLQVAAVSALVRANTYRDRGHFLLAGVLCAACFSTDLSASIPLALFFLFYLVLNPSLFPVLASFILFSVPQLARFSLSTPTGLEERFLEEWFQQNLIANMGELQIILFSLGPLLLLFALLQLSSEGQKMCALRRHKRAETGEKGKEDPHLPISTAQERHGQPLITLGIYWIPFSIPLMTGYVLPFWHSLDPTLIFRMSAVPLCVLSGIFLVRLREHMKNVWFFLGLAVLCAVIHHSDPFLTLPHSGPTVTENSLSAYQWIQETTPHESYFCNFISHGDSSTWIPAAAQRRIFLPSHLYYQGDNAMSSLLLAERFTDAAVLTRIPDSVFSYDILKKNGFSHVYIDEKSPVEGSVLIDSSLYSLEFHEGSVYIFSLTDKAPSYTPVQYQPGKMVWCGRKSYFQFSNIKSGSLLIIYYKDTGDGNVDIEINDTYVGTIYRFNSHSHFSAVFVFDPSHSINVSVLPHENTFEIEYLVVYTCSSP